jgi:hypothetical protein
MSCRTIRFSPRRPHRANAHSISRGKIRFHVIRKRFLDGFIREKIKKRTHLLRNTSQIFLARAFAMTLVSRPAPILHHFFLDFIFQ